jgi:hypothetical protein
MVLIGVQSIAVLLPFSHVSPGRFPWIRLADASHSERRLPNIEDDLARPVDRRPHLILVSTPLRI